MATVPPSILVPRAASTVNFDTTLGALIIGGLIGTAYTLSFPPAFSSDTFEKIVGNHVGAGV